MIQSDQDVSAAYTNFMKVYFPSGTGKNFYFWHFIGLKRPGMNPDGDWDFPEAVCKRVQALKGPHYRAVAKVMELNGADPYTSVDG